MQINKLYTSFVRHFQVNLWLYLVSILCICTGIVLGVYTVKYMGSSEKSDLINYFESFKDTINTKEINNVDILIEAIKNNVPIILGLWVLGLTIIGIPIILIIDIIKGFTLGFTVTFLISSMGINGIWMILIGVIPQNLIYLPCIILASVFGMELSIVKFREKANRQGSHFINRVNINYSISFLIISLAMILGFMFEAYLTPMAVKIIVSNIGSVMF